MRKAYQGEFNKETVYADNPVEMALRWAELGAEYTCS